MNTRFLRLLVHGKMGALFFIAMGFFGYQNLLSGQSIPNLLISMLLLAVPLGVLFFSLGLLWEAWLRRRQGPLGKRISRVLYLLPRMAGLLVAVFTGLFALDVFGMGGTIWQQIGAFLVHAAPAIFMLVLLAVAWRWEWVGALAFGVTALFMLRFVIGSPDFGLGNMLIFVLPMTMVAGLFWVNWRWKDELRAWRAA